MAKARGFTLNFGNIEVEAYGEEEAISTAEEKTLY